MEQSIFDKFSSHEWLVVRDPQLNVLKLPGAGDAVVWKDVYKDEDSSAEWWKAHLYEIIVSPPVMGYQIIEGKPLVYEKIADQLINDLSANQAVYWFQINLWLPLMQFKVFENGKCTRNYELYYDNKSNELIETSIGPELIIEQQAKELPIEEEEYGEFWMPLAIMEKMGIHEQALLGAFEQPCHKLLLSDDLKKIIDETQ